MNMFDIHRVEIEWGGRKLKLETGHMARQADAAVYAQYGETSVLATVVGAKKPASRASIFPLTVNYQERTYAAGKIPGGYFKREGRAHRKGDADLRASSTALSARCSPTASRTKCRSS